MAETNKIKIDLSGLPRTINGKNILWRESIGYIIPFEFEDIKDEIKIVNVFKDSSVALEYNGKQKTFRSCSVQEGNLKNFLNIDSYKPICNIGENIIDNKRDLIVLEIESRPNYRCRNEKWGKFHCNKCGYEFWARLTSVKLQGTGCPLCCTSHQVTIEGVNDITTTDPWMIPYFQGGYEEAKLYSYGSHTKIYPVCPDCGKIKTTSMPINKIYHRHSIGCSCGDKVSYPEKFFAEFLNQLNIEYIYQLTKTKLEWCNNYKYDFYIPSLNCIIETNGQFHYRKCKFTISLEEQQKTDKIKYDLALENDITNYIVIDCCKSELQWIKNSIMESDLPKLLNFKECDINWIKCGEYATKNLVKEVCLYYTNNSNLSTLQIANLFKLSIGTIINYLKKGAILWDWCNYDVGVAIEQRKIKCHQIFKEYNGKPIKVLKNNICIGIFESGKELENQSMALFGNKLYQDKFSKVCNHKLQIYKGYTFQFISKEEYNKLKGEINEKKQISRNV